MKALLSKPAIVKSSLTKWQQPVAWLFFVLLLLLGLFIYRDYGVPWDEIYAHENGLITAKYLLETFYPQYLESHNICPDCPPLHEYVDTDHAPLFELVPTFLQGILPIEGFRQQLFIRHLCVFLLFWVSCIFFYRMLRDRFRNGWWALLGTLLLVLSPRIFADAFFNSKDLPFLSLFIISLYTLGQYLRKRSYASAAWHALACALATDVRLMGIIVPAVTIAASLYDLVPGQLRNTKRLKQLRVLGFYVALLFGFIVLFWPYLWESPVENLLSAFASLSKFVRWTDEVLYFGKLIPADQVPWHYSLGWLFMTTPVAYSIFFLVGSYLILRRLISRSWRFYANTEEQQDLIHLALFAGPVLAVIIFESVLYDGWRQLFFIYPPFLAVALVGLKYFCDKLKNWSPLGLRMFAVAFGIFLLSTAIWMVRNHPYQNVYFSVIGGKTAFRNFERDYWGLSYRQGLEHLLKHDKREQIKIAGAHPPVSFNALILPENQRRRLKYVPFEEAEYYLTSHRFYPHLHLPQAWNAAGLNYEIWHTIKVDGGAILTIYKLR